MTKHKGLKISNLDVPIFCRLDQKTATDLRKYVSHNHIPLSFVIDEAVKLYLGSHESGLHTHISRVYKERPISSGLLAIIEEMKKRYLEKEITLSDLEDIIRKVRGNDKRTVENWKKSLKDIQFLKLKIHLAWNQEIYWILWSKVPRYLWPEGYDVEIEKSYVLDNEVPEIELLKKEGEIKDDSIY